VATRPGGVVASQAEHRAIVDGIKRGQPDDARAAMELHLSWSKQLMSLRGDSEGLDRTVGATQLSAQIPT
jgi:DNA-binding FadR family transcriptional regulator